MNSKKTIPLPHKRLVDLVLVAKGKRHISQSYGIFGPKGVGKKKIVEKIIEELYPNGNFNHPDVIAINANDEDANIEKVRTFIARMQSTPIASNFLTGVIFNADRLSNQSQNVLLKTLEEPSAHASIFLTISNEDNVLGTIRSRLIKLYATPIGENELQTFFGNQRLPSEAREYVAGRPEIYSYLLDEANQEKLEGANKLLEKLIAHRRRVFQITKHLQENEEMLPETLAFWISDIRRRLKSKNGSKDFLLSLLQVSIKILQAKTNENPYRLIESTCLRFEQ